MIDFNLKKVIDEKITQWINEERDLNDKIMNHIKYGDITDAYPLIPKRDQLRGLISYWRQELLIYNLKIRAF